MSAIKEVRRFNALCTKIRAATPVTAVETPTEQAARIDRLLASPADFQSYYFPQMSVMPIYLRKPVQELLSNPEAFMWWNIFRGGRKTTWACVIVPMMLKARGQLNMMLLVMANEKAAGRWLGNLQAQFESNMRYQHDFGPQMKYGSWADGEFVTADGTPFLGIGMGQPPRSTNMDMKRPDYIVCSDLDSKELSKNPARVREMYNWIKEDLMGAFATGEAERTRFLFDNNLFSKTSIGQMFKENDPDMHIYRVPILNAKGEVADPSFLTKAYVDKLRRRIGYRAFEREYMLNPVEEGAVFKTDWILYKKPLPLLEYRRVLCYIDPSKKAKTTSDYKALVMLGVTDKEIHVLNSFCRQTTPTVLIDWLFEHYKSIPEGVWVQYHLEANADQDELLYVIDEECANRGIYLPVYGDFRAKGNKEERIANLVPLFERHKIFFAEYLKEDEDTRAGISQILAFEKGSQAHDDYPDALHSGVWMLLPEMRSAGAEPAIGQRIPSHQY